MARGRGRPTKLTPELQEQIVGYLRGGNYLETAAQACGLAVQTLRDWLRRGARARSGRYHEFSVAVEKARAEGEVSGLAVITRASLPQSVKDRISPSTWLSLPDEVKRELARMQGPGEWQAMAWRLERTMPSKYGRRMEVTGKGGRPLVPPGRLSAEEMAAAVKDVLAGAGVADTAPGDD